MIETIINENYEIIKTFNGKVSLIGKYAGCEKNKYWYVKNKKTNEKHYLMECSQNILVKIDEESISKILDYNKIWTMCNNYAACEYEINKKIYMHAFLMNHVGHGTEKGVLSVDHINRDKLDNRLSNLRLETQSVQNENRDKKNRMFYARSLPEGIEQKDLRIFVTYNVDYEKELDSNGKKVIYRDFFRVEHPKLDKVWSTSKSMKISILDKLKHANKVAEDLDNNIFPIKEETTMPKYYSLANSRNKNHLVYERRIDGKRNSLKMVLPEIYDLEEQLEIIQKKVKDKYNI